MLIVCTQVFGQNTSNQTHRSSKFKHNVVVSNQTINFYILSMILENQILNEVHYNCCHNDKYVYIFPDLPPQQALLIYSIHMTPFTVLVVHCLQIHMCAWFLFYIFRIHCNHGNSFSIPKRRSLLKFAHTYYVISELHCFY